MLQKKIDHKIIASEISKLTPIASKFTFSVSAILLFTGVICGWIYHYAPSRYACTMTLLSWERTDLKFVSETCYVDAKRYNVQSVVIFVFFLLTFIIQSLDYSIMYLCLSGKELLVVIKKFRPTRNRAKSVGSETRQVVILDGMMFPHKKNVFKYLMIENFGTISTLFLLIIGLLYVLYLNDYILREVDTQECTVVMPSVVKNYARVVCYSAFAEYASYISITAVAAYSFCIFIGIIFMVYRTALMANLTNDKRMAYRVDAYCDRFGKILTREEKIGLSGKLKSIIAQERFMMKEEEEKRKIEKMTRQAEDVRKHNEGVIKTITNITYT